jgi:hypothetical protein
VDASDAWLATLPADEVHELLRLLLAGQGQSAERTLKARFAAWLRSQQPARIEPARRTVAELQQRAEEARQARHRQAIAARTRAEAERRQVREAALRKLAENVEGAWAVADQMAAQGTATGYDQVRKTLVDLADAYALCATRSQFQQRLQQFMVPYARRSALVRRLVSAGLWQK